MTLRLTEIDEVREFVAAMTAYMAYTADLESPFAAVKSDPTVSSKATADECIASLRKKNGVEALPYIAPEV